MDPLTFQGICTCRPPLGQRWDPSDDDDDACEQKCINFHYEFNSLALFAWRPSRHRELNAKLAECRCGVLVTLQAGTSVHRKPPTGRPGTGWNSQCLHRVWSLTLATSLLIVGGVHFSDDDDDDNAERSTEAIMAVGCLLPQNTAGRRVRCFSMELHYFHIIWPAWMGETSFGAIRCSIELVVGGRRRFQTNGIKRVCS